MAFIGAKPTNVPLTANDITDGSISVAKLTSTLDLSSNTVTLPSGVGEFDRNRKNNCRKPF